MNSLVARALAEKGLNLAFTSVMNRVIMMGDKKGREVDFRKGAPGLGLLVLDLAHMIIECGR